MSKADDIVTALQNNPNGIDEQDISAMGLEMNEFCALKSNINNKRGVSKRTGKPIKHSDIQIIRHGNHGNSRWKLAENNARHTIEFNAQRVIRETNSIMNSVISSGMAIANEPDANMRVILQQKAANQIAERQQLITIARTI